jgi:hypothetical protein
VLPLFSFFYMIPSQIYSSFHCLVDVSSETLDLCVLLPYSSKFNLFPLFLSGTALAKVLFFSSPPILHNDAIRYSVAGDALVDILLLSDSSFSCWCVRLFVLWRCMHACVCALAFPIISIWCSSAPTNAHKNRIEKRKDSSSTKGRNSWKKR